MQGINKEDLKGSAEFYLTVSMEVYVILVLSYTALAWAGYLPANVFSHKVVIGSLGVFAMVRLVAGIARGRRVVN